MIPYTVIDIETVASSVIDSPEWRTQVLDSAKAPSNWKDEKKIAAFKLEELEKRIHRASLSPMTGEVAAVVLQRQGNEPKRIEFVEEMGERLLLEFLADELDRHPAGRRLVGFNVRDFDIPFLWARFALSGLLRDKPSLSNVLPRPRDYNRVGELRDVLTDGGLYEWAAAFGYDVKPWTPKQYRDASVEDLLAKCHVDVDIEADLAGLFEGAMSCTS